MSKHNPRLQYLFSKYISGEYSPEELNEFWDHVEKLDENDPLLDQMKAWWDKYEGQHDLSGNVDSQKILSRILTKPADAEHGPVKRVYLRNSVWLKYAAVILLLAGIGTLIFVMNNSSRQLPLVQKNSAKVPDDVAPGNDKAILTLSTGQQVILDDKNKSDISDAGMIIKKEAGQLVYGKTDIVAFNTMTTPRGGQYKLILPDGTKVWLNAASSITYPTVFTNNERRVVITGEAYFEVAKNAELPFKVGLPDQSEIQVLGTHFNINSYADEPLITTTLLEGAVKINNSILKPGEAYSNGKVYKANAEEAVAWKNGVFIFNKTDLQSVMRQLARWYDVDIKYEGNLRIRTFSGKILRDLSLSDLLDGLKRTDVHFRIEGKSLIVTS